VAVGAWLAGRGRRRDQSRMPAFGLAVAACGAGSVDYHGPGSPAARLLHDGTLYLVVGMVAWHEVTRRARRIRLASGRRVVAYRLALAAAATGAACWWAGRTTSPWCDPDSLLQPHAAWHLLGATALAAWGWAVLEGDRG
jgi:hypothetical protein